MQGWIHHAAGTVGDTTIGGADPGVANASMDMDMTQDGGLRISCEPVYTSVAEEASASMVDNFTPYLPVEEPSSAASFGLAPGRRSGNLIGMGR